MLLHRVVNIKEKVCYSNKNAETKQDLQSNKADKPDKVDSFPIG